MIGYGGLGWRARTIEGQFSLAPELTPGMNRPGPPELWERFDAATADLAKALSGSSPATLAAAFTELSEVCALLSADVRRTHRPARDDQFQERFRHLLRLGGICLLGCPVG